MGETPMHSDAALWIDPARYSGEVCVMGSRVPADTVASLCIARGIEETRQWDFTDRQILAACWWVLTREWVRQGDKRTQLGQWASKAGEMLWHSDGPLPDPPPLTPGWRSDR